MATDDETAERIADAIRKVRFMLKTDDQLDALDELMEYLLSLEGEERQRVCDDLIAHLKEKIEKQQTDQLSLPTSL